MAYYYDIRHSSLVKLSRSEVRAMDGQKRYGAIPRREEVDWLMIDHMEFVGKKNSSRYLWLAQECATMATKLNETGRYKVYSSVKGDTVGVYVQNLSDYKAVEHVYVLRTYPYYGLQACNNWLFRLCKCEGLPVLVERP